MQYDARIHILHRFVFGRYGKCITLVHNADSVMHNDSSAEEAPVSVTAAEIRLRVIAGGELH